jgi:hypothetical protein
MKIIHLLICAFALFLSSCTLSNEQKAEKLIKEVLSSTLYHPESYKPISTQIDSAFIDFESLKKFGTIYEELIENIKKEKDYEENLKEAETYMSIWSPSTYYYSEHQNVQYNQYKEEYNEYKNKLERITPKVSSNLTKLRNESKNIFSKEHTGWIVTHKFTSKNGANTANIPGEASFFFNIDFTKCGSGIDTNEFNKLFKLIKKISEVESDEELKEELLYLMDTDL